MTPTRYQICQCERPDCRFRFPIAESSGLGEQCPRCGAPARPVDAPYASQETPPTPAPDGPEIEALLDNIRSVYNVGSMFRTADGAGVRHMHLCGITPTPDHPNLAKTALGAQKAVPWTQYHNGVDTAVSLKEQGFRLWAMEGGRRSQPIFEIGKELHGAPIILVVGNERAGVDPHILAQCERVLSIPMQGHKRSLNVAVAFGIAVYFLRFQTTLA